jgi:hypothetical protein
MDINMGNGFLDPIGNYEDKKFQTILHSEQVSSEELKKHIEVRNEDRVWGFKFPSVHNFFPAILPFFNNPYLIFVFRDPYAVALSEYRRDGGDLIKMMQRTIFFNNKMVALMHTMARDYPIHPISFEHLLTRTSTEIERLVEFVREEEADSNEVDTLINLISIVNNQWSAGYNKEAK